MFDMNENFNQKPVIKVIGVGGGGGNAVNRMIEDGRPGRGVHRREHRRCRCCRPSQAGRPAPARRQAHRAAWAPARIPRSAAQAALEDARTRSREVLAGADMVFITAGMGGGTGTGAAPVIAKHRPRPWAA
ncbi:MAG: hypothetical protein MZU97_11385 [Bacillus subtilis]|nr:hypothetical protein [Bacillus subtilis]